MKLKEKMKKHLSVILSVLIIATALPMSIFATDIASRYLTGTDAMRTNTDAEQVYEGVCGENAYWTLDKKGTLTISGTGKVNSNPWEKDKIKKVIISEGITDISEGLFSRCINLVEVLLPNSLITIGTTAFANCTSLKSIIIPSSIKYISEGTFYGCSALISVIIPDTIKYIDIWAFVDTSLETVHFLGTEADWNNISFDEIENQELADSEKHFCEEKEAIAPSCVPGHLAGWYCKDCAGYVVSGDEIDAITEHKYNDELLCSVCGEKCKHEKIYISGCGECKRTDVCGENLTWTLDENGTLTISGTGEMANPWDTDGLPWLNEPSEIKRVVIEEGVTTIGSEVFYGCTNLTDVTIPNTVTRLYARVFYGCTSLESITMPDSITTVSSSIFSGCTNLTDVKLSASITTIEPYMFSGCTGLKTITIPENIDTIDRSAFSGCTNLESVIIEGINTSIIGDYNFEDCENLKHIIKPGGVRGLPTYSFSGCKSLTSIEIHRELRTLGTGALSGCSNIESITISENVKFIEWDFCSGTNLEIIHYLGTAEQWDDIAIYGYNETILNAERHYVTRLEEPIKVAATCTEVGYTSDIYCEECQEYIITEKTALPLGHSFTNYVSDGNATCTTDGTKTAKCDNSCGETDKMTETATGHSYITHAAKAPTCTEAGWKAYETCENCDYTTYEAVPSTGHSYSETVTAPTCEKEGYTTYKCDCGDTYVADKVPSTGHSFTNYNSDGNATCIANGTNSAYCDNNCGAKDTQVIENSTTDHADKNNDGSCDECGEKLREDEDNSFFGKIKAFFQRIIDWFRNLFK